MDASHLFIGLAGFSLTAETYVVNGIDIYFPLCFFVGFSTVVFYGIHRLVQIKKYRAVESRRMDILKSQEGTILFFVVACALVASVLLFIYFISLWWLWLITFIGSIFYLFPLLPRQQRIRDLPYLKIWAIAAMWPLVTIGLPWLVSDLKSELSGFLFIEHFLFFVLITLPFDIRDQSEDSALGLRTLATNLSRQWLNMLGACVFGLLSLVIWLVPFSVDYAMALEFLSVVALILLWKSNANRPLWYYSFLLDGLILMRLMLFLFIKYL